MRSSRCPPRRRLHVPARAPCCRKGTGSRALEHVDQLLARGHLGQVDDDEVRLLADQRRRLLDLLGHVVGRVVHRKLDRQAQLVADFLGVLLHRGAHGAAIGVVILPDQSADVQFFLLLGRRDGEYRQRHDEHKQNRQEFLHNRNASLSFLRAVRKTAPSADIPIIEYMKSDCQS